MHAPKHTIELVKKWLVNPDSVSEQELRKAAENAYAFTVSNIPDTNRAEYAAIFAADAVLHHNENKDYAKEMSLYWVREYEKLAQKEV